MPELSQEPSDLVVSKSSWGAFATTNLKARLDDLVITQGVLCGAAASIGSSLPRVRLTSWA